MRKLTFISILFFTTFSLSAQPVAELKKHYSGKITWDNDNQTLTFKTSGKLQFTGPDSCMNYFWMVPLDVKKIIINSNTQVTAGIHTFDDCTIEGKDRKTSVIYGTPEQSWANNRKISAWKYSHILNHKGVLKMNNLTMVNPYSYFVRSYKQEAHLSNCDFYDYRDGHHNHSDGFAGGDGSTVDNCYFATGDDAIKVYDDVLVTNCTIEMVKNCVPIQLGWGNYSNGAVGTFKNLTIVGESGRFNSDNAVICGRTGSYNVTINIDGLTVKNHNAVMVSLYEEGMVLNGEIKNAEIDIKAYTDRRYKGTDNLIICGKQEKKAKYNCK